MPMMWPEPGETTPTVRLAGAYLEITSACNARCPYCYNNSAADGACIPLPALHGCLDELLAAPGPVSLTLSGGEPCLHPDLLSLLEKAAPLHPLLITNASFLHQKQYRSILQYGSVQLTLEHPIEEMHDAVRGPGNYSAVRQACLTLERNPLHHLQARVNVSAYNVEHLHAFAPLAAELGFSELHYAFLLPSGRPGAANSAVSFAEDPARAMAIIDEVDAMKQQTFEGAAGPLRIVNRCKPRRSCALTGSLVDWQPRITPNGDVYVCEGFMDKTTVVGNIHRDTLEAMTRSASLHALLHRIRSRTQSVQACEPCPWRSVCLKGCPGEVLGRTGSLTEKSAECAFYRTYFAKKLLQKSRAL